MLPTVLAEANELLSQLSPLITNNSSVNFYQYFLDNYQFDNIPSGNVKTVDRTSANYLRLSAQST